MKQKRKKKNHHQWILALKEVHIHRNTHLHTSNHYAMIRFFVVSRFNEFCPFIFCFFSLVVVVVAVPHLVFDRSTK